MILRSSATALAVEFRQAARRLFRSPGFAALAIGTLTVGIGINGAMFALMDALLFRPRTCPPALGTDLRDALDWADLTRRYRAEDGIAQVQRQGDTQEGVEG